jgi:hypothetical protein
MNAIGPQGSLTTHLTRSTNSPIASAQISFVSKKSVLGCL